MRKDREEEGIELIPLLDVVFLLLVSVIFALKTAELGLRPSIAPVGIKPSKIEKLYVNKEGRIFIGEGEEISLKELQQLVKREAIKPGKEKIGFSVEVDFHTPAGWFMDLLKILSSNDIQYEVKYITGGGK